MNVKRKKRIIITAAVMLCIAAAIVISVLLYVYFSHKKVAINGVPYKEIMENTTIPTKQYDNLDLSDAVLNIPKVDKFYSYYKLGEANDIYTPKEAAQLCRKMFPVLFDITDTDGLIFGNTTCTPLTDEQAWDPTFHDCSFYISYPDFVYDTDVGRNHGFADVNLEGTFLFEYLVEYGLEPDSELIETINIDRGEQVPDKSYDLRGGEYKMSDAVEFGNKTIEKLKDYLPDAQLQPSKLCVYKTTEYDKYAEPCGEYYQYQIEYEFVLDGIPLSDSYSMSFNNLESLYKVSVNQVLLVIDTPDKVSTLTHVGPYMLTNKESKPLKDEYITLESACDLLSDYLAPNYMQHIDEITIKYAAAWDNTKHYGDDEKRSTRPCWCFIKDDGFDGNKNSAICEKQLLVDMQTGDIIAYVGDRYESTLSHENDKSVLQQQLDEWDGQANGS